MTYFEKKSGEEEAREKKVYYRYFDLMDWIVVGGVYVDELYAPLHGLIKMAVVVTLGIFCLVVPVAMLLGKSLARPIQRLAASAQAIGKGKLDIEIPVTQGDEIGDLGKTFNLMLNDLKTLLGQVQRAGIQVTSSTTELAATAREQEAIMNTQVDSASKIVKSVEEISGVAGHLVETTHEVGGMLQEAVTAASDGQGDLQQMQGAMHSMEEASQTISGRLQTINEKAENITQVVTTITKVAEQTNLLSLNASIEAEKAGEFGRGFTVVAREIRRLADQTAVATLDIEQVVKEMQSAVSAGVMEMDKFIAEVRHNAEQVGSISTQLTHIIDRVQLLSPHFDEVRQAMGYQSGSAQKINTAIVQLNEEMQQTRDSLHETYSVIEQLNEAARSLQEQVSRFTFA
jgi:methyl-accepting chemotaxis protein WspA